MDKLNSLSYAYHYRNIDSTEHYARQAYDLSADYDNGRGEALNNLAFVAMVHMDYEQAERQLQEAIRISNNQIELLVAEIGYMRLCQRRSENRAFYEHRERALEHLKRIQEESTMLPERMRQRMIYAESEMAIVNSTYYYYVGLEQQSIEALQKLNTEEVHRDTAQYLNYLYNIGAGGILSDGTPEEIRQEEMDYLNRCLSLAQRLGYPYFEANAKEALADHMGELALAEEALDGFRAFGDVYQIAGAYRTLASCYHAMGDDEQALEQLHLALADSAINQAPDLVASIREQLSVAYAAVNDKPQSDYNRNIYIDLQEQTRQDRELEARAGLLDEAVKQLNWMILAVMGAILLLVLLLWLFSRQNKRRKEDDSMEELLELKQEEVDEARLRVEKNERNHLEQRAKVSLAMSILPLIDRILYTIDHLKSSADSGRTAARKGGGEVAAGAGELEYVRELTDNINEQNELLTEWIQLRQGELSLHIESFALQQLFDIVVRSQTSFRLKGLTLTVRPTEATVKADRVLTLFMLNTLADNARKFTPEGGQVSIAAEETADYVEVSVEDTGRGMSAEELAHVFDHKVQQGHGFGLMNCKGIIEKYRKLSQLFSVCRITATSEEGRGSRFSFRLPKGVVRVLAFGLWLFAFGQPLMANSQSPADYSHQATAKSQPPTANLDRAHIFADSAYFSNVNGTYERTLEFADSCRYYLNLHYLQSHPQGGLLMTRDGDDKSTPSEIQWLRQGVDMNYQIVLDIRNESAVAALALHQWLAYAYNNKVYTQLFKEMSADSGLADYCRTMQQSQQNKRIAVILLVTLLIMIIPVYYMLYYRHRLSQRFRRERQQQTSLELLDDELRRCDLENQTLHVSNAVLDNCLSTLKHETMYYPSRIRQLIDDGDQGEQLSEVTRYYRDLYSILIQQALGQVERIHLHVRPIKLYDQNVLGDENLLRYLFELIKGQVKSEVKDEQYVVYHVRPTQPLTQITRWLARQILRDHGEATNRRGCGITMEKEEIRIILPKQNGTV